MTDMRIVKVLIEGELPKRCYSCKLFETKSFEFPKYYGKCRAAGRSRKFSMLSNSRPTWCPLVKQKGGEE